MATSLRRTDTAVEAELAKFLDEHFYPRYVTNFHRHSDLDAQFRGIDVHFDLGGKTMLPVDEKAQVHYINKGLPTFAFEMNFINARRALQEGWLFDETKETQYYALMWIRAKKNKDIVAADITEVEVLLVERRKLLVLLAGHGCDKHRAQLTAARIRLEGIPGKYEEGEKPFYCVYTTQLAEQPINIVVKKEVLVEMALGHWVVRPG